jgi:hypothetical protein
MLTDTEKALGVGSSTATAAHPLTRAAVYVRVQFCMSTRVCDILGFLTRCTHVLVQDL